MRLSTHWQRHAWRVLASAAAILSACGGGRSPLLEQTGESRDAAPEATPEAAPCPAQQSLCNTYCTATQVDPENCGGCGIACNPGQLCVNGLCATNCGSGQSVCTPDGGAPYCANLQTDNANCGQCGRTCPAGKVCSAGTCKITCGAPLTQCGKGGVAYCANLGSDNDNCGVCGKQCADGQVCWNGACANECVAPLTDCDGSCTDTETDPQHCGACSVSCGPYTHGSAICSNGSCLALCDPGYLDCPSGFKYHCVDPTSDRQNCGGCGQSCKVGCAASSCLSVADIAAGPDHTCAVLSDGSVDCWGGNSSGQLGDGTTKSHPSPKPVPGLAGAIALSAGFQHTCVVLAKNGSVMCWGLNDQGQLGDGTTTTRPSPTVVPGLGGAASVATARDHTCALLSDGWVACWGNGSLSPQPVAGLGGVAALATGSGYTCALLETGTVECWGGNGFGELGDGTTTARASPTPVPGLSNVVAIAAGFYHTCALLAGGSVECWGFNHAGQIGDGTNTDRHSPTLVQGVTNAVSISASADLSCAALSDGSVHCWGAVDPAPDGLSNAVELGQGGGVTCAILDDGSADCWGRDFEGEIGNGTYVNNWLPPTPVKWP